MKITLADFLLGGIVDMRGCWRWFGRTIRLSAGRINPGWEAHVYPPSDVAGRRRLIGWSRAILAFHVTVLAVGVYCRLWMLPVVITFASFYGGWLLFLLNNTQHVGLCDKVPDFRLCCRTILINPFFRFLYWHMNYHTEHHMYAAVPCYNLKRLHEAVRSELQSCPRGVLATWREIIPILKRQKLDPDYRHRVTLPGETLQA